MSGHVIRVCPPRQFDFSELGDGGSGFVTVAERIDCSQYQHADLLVRVHTDATFASGCSMSVVVVSDGFTTDDPSQDFFSAALGQGGIIFNGSDPPTAGTLEVATYSSRLGAMLAVFVVGQQAGTAPAPPSIQARLSIDLTLREC
ncbi:MAG: hypothetical protein H6719_16465 [Sandaracinaceae bacterium]|nr:hypothetical protein [Sandaracinaceae bacterium]